MLASIGPRDRPLDGCAPDVARTRPSKQARGVTNVVSLHHQVYARLPDRLSRRGRLDRSTVRAETRPERADRNVAFGCRRRRGASIARPDRPSHRARPHHSLLAAPLGRSRRGGGFVIAPFAFKFFGLDAWYYWVLAAAVLLTTSVFNAPEEPVATRSGLDRRTAG